MSSILEPYGQPFSHKDDYTVPAFLDDDSAELPYLLDEFEDPGIDPREPTAARPGSEAKVAMLSARYAAGLPLWHTNDCHDHSLADDPAATDAEAEDADLEDNLDDGAEKDDF